MTQGGTQMAMSLCVSVILILAAFAASISAALSTQGFPWFAAHPCDEEQRAASSPDAGGCQLAH